MISHTEAMLDCRTVLPDLQNKLVEPALAVFFVGSRAEGVFTSDSDVDFIVVLPGEASRAPEPGRFIIGVAQGRRYEATLVREGEFLKQLKSEPGADRRGWLHMTRKLICGIPVLGEAYGRQLQGEGSRSQLAAVANAYFHESAADGFDGFCDFHADQRHAEALSCIRRSLSEAAESVLVLSGDLFFKEKWRIARIRRTFPQFRGLAPLTALVSECVAGAAVYGSVADYAIQCSRSATWLNLVSLCPELLDSEMPLDWQQHVETLPRQLLPFALLRGKGSRVVLRSIRRGFEVETETARSITQYALSIPTAATSAGVESFVKSNLYSSPTQSARRQTS